MKKSHLLVAASLLLIIIPASLIFASAHPALTITELKGDWVPDIAKSVQNAETDLRERLKKNGMAPEDIEKRVKEDSFEVNLRHDREVISFDASHFAFLQGNQSGVVDAQYEQVESDVVAITVTLSGKPMVIRASGDAAKGIRITGSSDKQFHVWVKAPAGESALNPKYMAPPAKDADGMVPSDVLAKVAELAAAGDEAALKGYFSAECLSREYRDGVVVGWKRNKQMRSQVPGEFTMRDASDVLTQFKIRSCVRMARVEGDVYTVEAVYVSPDGKSSGYTFYPYFKQIGGRWKIVASFTYN